MEDFPAFMKHHATAIAAHQQSPGGEGYVFDGDEGSQTAVFTCSREGLSTGHVHPFGGTMNIERKHT